MKKHIHWLLFIVILLTTHASATECLVTLDGKVELDWLICDVQESQGVISFEQGNLFTAEIKGGVLRSNIKRIKGPKALQYTFDEFGRTKVNTDGITRCYFGENLKICTRLEAAEARAADLPSPPTKSPPCKRFAEGQSLNLTGFLAITDQKGEEQEIKRRPYMFLFLDMPLCFETNPTELIKTIEISGAPKILLGRHIAATAKMSAGLDWFAEIKKIGFKSER